MGAGPNLGDVPAQVCARGEDTFASDNDPLLGGDIGLGSVQRALAPACEPVAHKVNPVVATQSEPAKRMAGGTVFSVRP